MNLANTKVLFKFLTLAVFVVSFNIFSFSSVKAFPNPGLSQEIRASSLTTDIKDIGRNTINEPSVSMSSRSFSFGCSNGSESSTGTFGTNLQRIYITNPGAANNGWTLTMAASSPTAVWQGTQSNNKFDFNDPTTSGCSDSNDLDTKSGQMSVDASVASLTPDCGGCGVSEIAKSTPNVFVEGSTDSITLLNATTLSDENGQWYLTDVLIKQTIPAETPVDTYSIDFTVTVTAS